MTADVPRRFSPLRPAPQRTLTAVAVLGPLLWIVALLILDVALRKWDAVQIGLLVALGSFVVALLYLVPQRLMRVRRERAGWQRAAVPPHRARIPDQERFTPGG